MVDYSFSIDIASVKGLNRPFKANFGRINIILGANGTGKSKVLRACSTEQELIKQFNAVFYIEGGRVLKIPQTLALNSQNVQQYSTLDSSLNHYRTKQNQNLGDRLPDALFTIEQLSNNAYRTHSDLIENLVEKGCLEDCPRREKIPIDQLCDIFRDVFPDIKVTIDPDSKIIRYQKNGSDLYPPSELSDGERQVFCLIADLLVLSKENSLIIVDEPELNLHPSLAIDFWSLIESQLHQCVFVYATHSIAFALRQSVNSYTILPASGQKAINIENLDAIDIAELPAFLGAIPAILTKPKTIIVEGKKESIDTILYPWLIGEKSVSIASVESCNNVLSVLKREGVWQHLGTAQALVGVIDRDFRTEKEFIKIRATKGAIVLPFHEIESILCIPKLIHLITLRLSLVKSIPTESDFINIIIDTWEVEYLNVAVQRTMNYLRTIFSINLTLTRNQISQLDQDQKRLEELIIQSYQSAVDSVSCASKFDEISSIFKGNITTCQEILKNKDIDQILQLIPGKVLVGNLLNKTGCKTCESMARSVVCNVKVEEINELIEVRTLLRNALNL